MLSSLSSRRCLWMISEAHELYRAGGLVGHSLRMCIDGDGNGGLDGGRDGGG